MRLRYDSSGDGPFIENLCTTCETYCGGECDEPDLVACHGCNVDLPDWATWNVDAENYCPDCGAKLVLLALGKVA